MSPPVAARGGEIGGTEARPILRCTTTLWGCTRLSELRHFLGRIVVPAHEPVYAASPIRSHILSGICDRPRGIR